MRRLGWILLSTSLAVAVLAYIFGLENIWLLLIFGVTFLLGMAILASSFAVRLYRGDIRLRLFDAAKTAIIVFSVMVTFRVLALIAFPSENSDLTQIVLASAGFAISYGLYKTAYRRPRDAPRFR